MKKRETIKIKECCLLCYYWKSIGCPYHPDEIKPDYWCLIFELFEGIEDLVEG